MDTCRNLQIFSPKLEQVPQYCQQTFAARKARAGKKGGKWPSSRQRVRGGGLEPDDDFEFSPIESLIFFPVLLDCSRVQNLRAPKGLWTAPRHSSCRPTKGYYGRTCSPVLHVPKGLCVEERAWCNFTPWRWSPPGDASGAEGGVAVHQGDDQWSCPD